MSNPIKVDRKVTNSWEHVTRPYRIEFGFTEDDGEIVIVFHFDAEHEKDNTFKLNIALSKLEAICCIEGLATVLRESAESKLNS